MSDHELILAIREELDGVEWTTDTLAAIADLLTEAGYPIRDCKDNDGQEV